MGSFLFLLTSAGFDVESGTGICAIRGSSGAASYNLATARTSSEMVCHQTMPEVIGRVESAGLNSEMIMFVDDGNQMITLLSRHAEMSKFPVDHWVESRQKRDTQNQIRVHRYNPQCQVELHGVHLHVEVHELGAWDTISGGSDECLAFMQPVAAQI